MPFQAPHQAPQRQAGYTTISDGGSLFCSLLTTLRITVDIFLLPLFYGKVRTT
jgi:hypothetical protein